MSDIGLRGPVLILQVRRPDRRGSSVTPAMSAGKSGPALGDWFTRYEVIRRCPDVLSEDLQWSRSGPGKASQELLPSCRGRGVVLDVARREPQTTWWPDES